MVLPLLVLWVLAEIAAVVLVAHAIGVWLCVLLVIAGWPVGSWLLRAEGRAALRRFRSALLAGRPPAEEAAEGALALAVGGLFIVPGFITDAVGLLLLLRPLRVRLARHVVRHARGRFVTRAAAPFGARRADDVEGTATDPTPRERPRLEG